MLHNLDRLIILLYTAYLLEYLLLRKFVGLEMATRNVVVRLIETYWIISHTENMENMTLIMRSLLFDLHFY